MISVKLPPGKRERYPFNSEYTQKNCLNWILKVFYGLEASSFRKVTIHIFIFYFFSCFYIFLKSILQRNKRHNDDQAMKPVWKRKYHWMRHSKWVRERDEHQFKKILWYLINSLIFISSSHVVVASSTDCVVN